jgi:hypothetical protein
MRVWVERQAVFIWQRCSQIGAGPADHRYMLRMGRSLELARDGQLIVRALMAVGYPNLIGGDHFWQSQPRTAPVGTVEAEKMLQNAVDELRDQLSAALEVFVNHLP